MAWARAAALLVASAICAKQVIASASGAAPDADHQHAGRTLATCATSIKWSSKGGNVLLNGQPFRIKGANYFGFETELDIIHGLWPGGTSMDSVLKFCSTNKINALRIPLSLALALNPEQRVAAGKCAECPPGAKAWDMLDKLFDKAAAVGILIVLDMHRMDPGETSELWYNTKYSEAQFIAGWNGILKRFGSKPNLLGIDIKNEPHGAATWGLNTPATDWNLAVERIVAGIKQVNTGYDKLLFIEGVGSSPDRLMTPPPPYDFDDPAATKFWGSNLDGVVAAPIDFGSAEMNDLIVYSTHLYGPDLYEQPYFSAPDFPNNMPDIWDKQVGFVEKATGRAVVIGEWGGKNKGKDKIFEAAFVDWMSKHCLGDAFIWAINPDSDDLGGILLKDWRTGDAGKLQLMSTLQPSPSVFTAPITAKQVCVDYGAFPPGVNCSGTAAAPADKGITTVAGGSSSDPYCANGIKSSSRTQKLCCSKECVDRQGKSICGTKECSAKGMAKKCCYSAVSKADKPCSSNTASCAPYSTRRGLRGAHDADEYHYEHLV